MRYTSETKITIEHKKGNEIYIFIYQARYLKKVLQCIREYRENPELSLDIYDEINIVKSLEGILKKFEK
ncbi:MAG: hypothetical protein WCX73_04780 [Candidatus Pacearchaeota archaeon]|jgi:hypothetical protein